LNNIRALLLPGEPLYISTDEVDPDFFKVHHLPSPWFASKYIFFDGFCVGTNGEKRMLKAIEAERQVFTWKDFVGAKGESVQGQQKHAIDLSFLPDKRVDRKLEGSV